jgi:hypothetical protein
MVGALPAVSSVLESGRRYKTEQRPLPSRCAVANSQRSASGCINIGGGVSRMSDGDALYAVCVPADCVPVRQGEQKGACGCSLRSTGCRGGEDGSVVGNLGVMFVLCIARQPTWDVSPVDVLYDMDKPASPGHWGGIGEGSWVPSAFPLERSDRVGILPRGGSEDAVKGTVVGLHWNQSNGEGN